MLLIVWFNGFIAVDWLIDLAELNMIVRLIDWLIDWLEFSSSSEKRRKCDRYRPLSPLISDTESGSVVSSVHVMSSAVVAKRLSQAEPPLPVPSRTPPCSPPPQPDLTTTTTQPANDTIVDSDPENVHPAVLHRHRIDSCGGTVASPHARPHSTGNPLPRPLSPANSAPFAPSKQQKWSSAHAHRYSQHHYCPPSSESSSSRQHHHHHQQQQQQQQEQELSPAMEQHAKRNAPYQQPFPGYPLSQATTMAAASARAHHRRRSNLSMAPTDEQHRWTWNLQPDTADNRVSERVREATPWRQIFWRSVRCKQPESACCSPYSFQVISVVEIVKRCDALFLCVGRRERERGKR